MKLFKQSTSSPYFLFMMFLISLLNYLDRQVLSIVQEDVKADLLLTDSQLGRLALVFGLMHALFAIPIGRVADRKPRKNILAACLVVWSGFTALCGAVGNYFLLLLARMGVGLGEAGVTPTSYSLVSDKFPLNRRATALAVLGLGIPIGSMLSLIIGGALTESIGWRMTFVVFGIPGFILALIFMLTVQAPVRGGADKIVKTKQSKLGETFRYLFTSRSFLLVFFGATLNAMMGYSMLSWMPSFYIREFNLTPGEVGLTYGLVLGGVGLVSILSSAYLADTLGKKDVRWYSWIMGISILLSTPLTYLALTGTTFYSSLAFFALGTFFAQATLAITNALIQSTAPVQMRGVASAIKTTGLSFLGYGLGGYIIGILSDYFATDNPGEGLKQALIYGLVFFAISGILFLLSATNLKKDIEEAIVYSEAG